MTEAWVELSRAYDNRAAWGDSAVETDQKLSREAIQRALALDPNSPVVYAQLSQIATDDHDLPLAAKHLNRALQLAPDDELVLRAAANLSSQLGRSEEVLRIHQLLVLRDPARPGGYQSLSSSLTRLRRWEEATANLRKALTLSPGAVQVHYALARILLAQGQSQLAMAEINQEPESSVWRLIGLPLVWWDLGDKVKSDASLAELIRTQGKTAAFQIAEAYAYRAEADKAFEWLEKAMRYRDPGLASVAIDRLFDTLHADPRWLPFLRKLGRAPEQLAGIQLDLKLPAQ